MYTETERGVCSGLLNRMQGTFRTNLGKKIKQTCFRQDIKRIMKIEDTDWTQNSTKNEILIAFVTCFSFV